VVLVGKGHAGDVRKHSVWLLVKLHRRRVICAETPLTMCLPKLIHGTGELVARTM
jgi:hypothetical protein